MKTAQVAIAVLVGVLIAAATVLLLNNRIVSGWIFGGFALFGFTALLLMIMSDARLPPGSPPA